MIIDGTLKDGEMGVYKDLHNGWVEKIETVNIKNQTPPIAKYGSVDIDELLKIMEKFKEIPDYDTLIKDNNKKDKEIEKLNRNILELHSELCNKQNTINELRKQKKEFEKWIKDDDTVAMITWECGRCFNAFDILEKLQEFKEG